MYRRSPHLVARPRIRPTPSVPQRARHSYAAASHPRRPPARFAPEADFSDRGMVCGRAVGGWTCDQRAGGVGILIPGVLDPAGDGACVRWEVGVPTWRDSPGLHTREDQAGDDRLMCVAADQEVMAAAGAGEHGRSPVFTSLRRSARARVLRSQRARNKELAAAMHSATTGLRCSGTVSPNGVPYDGTVHLANRNRAQAAVTSRAAWPFPAA